MSKTLQFKRYPTTALASITGANGEIIVDTTKFTLTVHDGLTAGGYPMVGSNTTANLTNLGVSGNVFVSGNLVVTGTTISATQVNTTDSIAISNVTASTSNTTGALTVLGGVGIKGNTYASAIYSYGDKVLTANTTNPSIGYLSSAGTFGVSYGYQAGQSGQGTQAVAIGNQAGALNQGQYSVAIGNLAGQTSQVANSIAINANTNALNPVNSGLYINPVRTDSANITNFIFYNPTTNELTYSPNSVAINAAAQTVPQNAQTATYALQLSDSGKHIYYTQSSNTILYIPNAGQVVFQNGATVMIVSQTTSGANVTITPNTGVSLYLAGNTTSASRNVTTYGMATLIRVSANTWFVNGTGVA